MSDAHLRSEPLSVEFAGRVCRRRRGGEDGAELLGTVVAGHSSRQRKQSRAVAAGKDYPPAAGTETGRIERGAAPSNTY